MPPNSTTPRKLRVTVELDVTEGPRLRRGTTETDMLTKMGRPIRDEAIERALVEFGLVTKDAEVSVQWGYVWMNADEKVAWDQAGNENII